MKTFHLTDAYALINLDAININSPTEIINSDGFLKVLRGFYNKLKKEDSVLLRPLKNVTSLNIVNFYKLLLVYDLNDALKHEVKITPKHIEPLYHFTEAFYDHWRQIERFGLLRGSVNYDPNLKVNSLIATSEEFNKQIIITYRIIAQKLLGEHFHVYRQLPAGITANLLYFNHTLPPLKGYSAINNIPFVTKALINPPFIINSKSNVRCGVFKPLTFSYNPLSKIKLNKSHFVAFPIMVGPLLAFVYIHRDFLHHGVALANLFEFADYNRIKDVKPNIVYIYGVEDEFYDSKFYHDMKNDIYLGFVARKPENDYFGYLKKMLLTLHNIYMLNHDNLPIHGAMFEITLKANIKKKVVIVGDSGAGKSETVEALRQIASKDIKDIKVVFDDMGTFKIKDGKIVANGTETGAFVRLDDLEQGYAYQIMDRALFMNPSLVNSRVVIPLAPYSFIMEDHNVDVVLYANNYEDKEGLHLFSKTNEALNVFKKGKRIAKGTTNEVGLTETYFANPFGPVQYEAQTDVLLKLYFTTMAENGVKIGEIYTKLGLKDEHLRGPRSAAIALLKELQG